MEDMAIISVSIRFPWVGKELRYNYGISRHEGECLRPLPKNREIEPWLMDEVRRQLKSRDELADMVGKMISRGLLHAVESEDTIWGYKKGD